LPRNDKGTHTEPLLRNDRGGYTDSHRQQRDLISPLHSLKIRNIGKETGKVKIPSHCEVTLRLTVLNEKQLSRKLRDFNTECFLPLSPECFCDVVKNSVRLKLITAEPGGGGGVAVFGVPLLHDTLSLSLLARISPSYGGFCGG
jgi:hypothetical protein